MNQLTKDQIDLVARSVALHASGATGATGHLSEFNVKTVEELATKIQQMLASPETQFIVNNSLSPKTSGTIIALNREQHSFLILNPNQLNEPRQSGGHIIPVHKGSADSLAGTFYNQPKLDINGNAALKQGYTIDSQFHEKLESLRSNIQDDLNAYPPEPGKTYTLDDVPVKSMGESDEIAQWVSRNEPRIRDGLAKATQRIESGAYVTQSIRDNVLKHGANGNLDLTVTDETRALSIQTPTKGTNFDITFAPGGESAQILSTSRNNAFSIDLNAEGTDALRSTLRETAIAENLRKIGELKNALKDSKVWAHLYKGGKIAGAGLLINGGALLLTREAMAKELEIADRLNKLPENHPMHLSDEAKADYLQMLDDVKLAREIDAGNPLPLAGAVSTTVATEATIMQKQAEFSQKHPGLSPELTSTLFISVVPTYGLRAEMEVYAMEALPSDPATAAPVLRPLIEANNAETIAEKNLDDANKAYNRFVFTTRGDPNPWLPPEDSYEQRLPAEQAKLDNARLAHEQAKIMRMDTFQKTMKSPEGMKQLTALMDKNQLLSLTQGARYQNHGSTSPEISAYLSAYKAAERENPTIQGSAMEYIAQKATDSLVTGFSGGMIERNEASIFGTAGEYIHDKAVDLVTTSDKEAAEQSARKVLFDNPEKMQEFVTSTFSSPLAQDAAAQAEAKAEAAPYTPVDTYVTLSNGEAVDLEQLKRIESMPEYNYMAIPLANMRDGWENDPIEIRDLHDTRNADATPKEAKDLIEARFTAQMEEIRAKELEARQEAERRLQEELERKRYLAQMNAQTNTPNNTTSPLGAPGMQAKAGMALSP